MEHCAKCSKEIDKTPHITCAVCGATFCITCSENETACPECGNTG